MRIQLPDVNVLVAMHDPDHLHHERAFDWFINEGSQGWATCPLTENGFLRVFTNTKYPNTLKGLAKTFPILDEMMARYGATHHFWEDRISLRDETLFRRTEIVGHKQITNVYLLGLCQSYNAVLVTLDTRVSVSALATPHADLLRLLV